MEPKGKPTILGNLEVSIFGCPPVETGCVWFFFRGIAWFRRVGSWQHLLDPAVLCAAEVLGRFLSRGQGGSDVVSGAQSEATFGPSGFRILDHFSLVHFAWMLGL